MASRERLAWAFGFLACLGVGVWALARTQFQQAPRPSVVRFTIAPPDGSIFTGANSTPRMAVSPDGQYVVFGANARDGTPDQLWVRRLDTLESRPVTNITETGGEPAQQPFWSPDSRTIGFYHDGRIRRVSLEGGATQVVVDVPGQNFSGSWGADGNILYSTSATDGLKLVTATGGVPTQVTRLDSKNGESQHLWPRRLPDGRHFLYQIHSVENRATFVGSLDGGVKVKVLDSPFGVEFAEPDWLLFVREDALLAQRISLDSFQLVGEPAVLSDGVQSAFGNGRAGVSASRTGVLAYRPGLGRSGADSQLAWLDRSGRELATVGDPASIRGVELSPDGRRAAIHVDEGDGRGDVWVVDLERSTTSRLTFEPQDHNQSPVWSKDGANVLYAKRGTLQIYERNASGVGAERVIYRSDDRKQNFFYPVAPAADGKTLILGASTNRWDILTAPFGAGMPSPFVATRAQESFGQLSPDGRWLAYQSDETGRSQVFVQSFPSGGTKFQVSTPEGGRPRWRMDGRELYFLRQVSSGEPLMAVSVEPGGQGLVLGTPRPLFPFQTGGLLGHDAPFFTYAPSPDGQRFLVSRPTNAVGSMGIQTPMTVVLNWQAAVR